jgi:hypothetical protein
MLSAATKERTAQVEFHEFKVDLEIGEERLHARAVRAVGLGEHEHRLVLDRGLLLKSM